MDSSADTVRYAAVMLTAGIGIPVLAALNAALGVRPWLSCGSSDLLVCGGVFVGGAGSGTDGPADDPRRGRCPKTPVSGRNSGGVLHSDNHLDRAKIWCR